MFTNKNTFCTFSYWGSPNSIEIPISLIKHCSRLIIDNSFRIIHANNTNYPFELINDFFQEFNQLIGMIENNTVNDDWLFHILSTLTGKNGQLSQPLFDQTILFAKNIGCNLMVDFLELNKKWKNPGKYKIPSKLN